MALSGQPTGAGPTEWPDEASGPLAGRGRELRLLCGVLDDLRDDAAHLVEITGEPGIGKTRLLAEFARHAQEFGYLVLSGRAAEADRSLPYGPMIDALDDHLADLGPDRIPQVGVDGDALLEMIFPALNGASARRADSVGAGDSTRLPRAVRRLLEGLATGRHLAPRLPALDTQSPRLVVLLDDLHWADQQSVKLLADLIRRPPEAPIVFVLAYRQRQASVRLRTAMVNACGGMPVRRLTLGPLNEKDAEIVLGGRGTRSWRRSTYRASGGNPGYLHALARSSSRRAGDERAGAELSYGVVAASQAELEATSPGARTVAHAAAVAGEQFGIELVAEIGGCDEASVRKAVDELVERDLIRPVAGGQQFAFRHALVRQGAYSSTTAGWRIAAHARAAAALGRRGAPAIARARHVEVAGRPGDLGAVEVLDEAARAITRTAPATAAAWLRVAARLLPHDGPTQQRRMSLLVRLARALGAAGHLQESRDVLHATLRLFPRGDGTSRVAAVVFCALIERLLGRRAEAEALLRDELFALDGVDTVARASLLFEMACGKLSASDAPACIELAQEVLGTARRHGSRPLEAAALGLIATATASATDIGTARCYLDDATEILDAMLDETFAESLDAALWVSWAEVLLERWDDALRHLDRAVEYVAESGRVLALPYLLVCRALVLRAIGGLAEAEACAKDAIEQARVLGGDVDLLGAHSMQRWVGVWTGDFEAAARAEAQRGTGDPDRRTALLGGAEIPWLLCAEACFCIAWYELMTRAELSGGNLVKAARWADRAEEAADRLGLAGRTGLALLARAQVLAASEPRAALQPAIAAVEALTGAGMVVDAARARVVVATALAAAGEGDRAAVELRVAQTAFESCGAQALVRQAVTERRRLAARSSRQPLPAPSSELAALTRRERQVASLVGEGLTNRAIAQRLWVTEKTIEMHLANVFAKLGVSSRASVASTVARAISAS